MSAVKFKSKQTIRNIISQLPGIIFDMPCQFVSYMDIFPSIWNTSRPFKYKCTQSSIRWKGDDESEVEGSQQFTRRFSEFNDSVSWVD